MASPSIQTDGPLVVMTKRLGWPYLLVGAFLTALGLWATYAAFWENDSEVIVVGPVTMIIGLGMLVLVRWVNRRGPRQILTLSHEGLRTHFGAVGLIPWDKVLGARAVTVARNPAVSISLAPGVFEQLEQTKSYARARKLDEALGIDSLVFFQSQLSVPIPELIATLEAYATRYSNAGPRAPH